MRSDEGERKTNGLNVQKKYRLSKKKQDQLDLVDVATMEMLLDKGEFEMFVRIYDTLQYLIFKVGVRMSPDQMAVLLLPFDKWGIKAGYILSEMRSG